MLTSSSPKYCSLWMNWSARPYETLLSCIARSIRRRHLIFPCGSLPHITRRFCDVAWNTSPDWRSVYVWNSGSLSFLLVVPSSQPKQDLKGSSFGDVQLKMIQDIIWCNPNYNTVQEKLYHSNKLKYCGLTYLEVSHDSSNTVRFCCIASSQIELYFGSSHDWSSTSFAMTLAP